MLVAEDILCIFLDFFFFFFFFCTKVSYSFASFFASEARRVLLTLLGLDGMGLDMMMSMVKLLLRYSQYHTKPTCAMHLLQTT